MNTIFMNSQNSQTYKPHVLILKITDKLDLRRGENRISLSNLSIYYTWKNIKISYNKNKFKLSAPTWIDKFNYLMDHILYQIFKIILKYILKKHGQKIDNPSIKIYANKIENRITFRIKNGCILGFLKPETIKLLGSTENKITKDKRVKMYRIFK